MEKSAPSISPSRGLLHETVSLSHFDLIRVAPSEKLAPFVENYWIILWDRQAEPPYLQENLPHPSQHLVIDPQGQSGIFGVQTGKFIYELARSGRIFGTKFWPGAFRAFTAQSMSGLTDTYMPIASIFDTNDADLESRFESVNDPLDLASDIEALLLANEPILTNRAKEARQLVALIATQPEINRIDELAKLSGLSSRALQRLFAAYIGTSPKWVIDRYRMLEAVDALNNGGDENLTALAHRLGYFDQAHFTRTFAALTGNPPSFYLAKSRAVSS